LKRAAGQKLEVRSAKRVFHLELAFVFRVISAAWFRVISLITLDATHETRSTKQDETAGHEATRKYAQELKNDEL
jgi:hypothetical protein